MGIEIRIEVVTLDENGDLIPDIEFTWEATMQSKKKDDEYARLLGDGNAKVSVSRSEKIGGPGYSSTSVHVSVGITCHQSKETIDAAARAAYAESSSLLDTFMDDAINVLHARLERLGE